MQAEIVGISFCIEPGHAAYLPLAHDYPGAPDQLDRKKTLAKLKPLLEDAEPPKVGHHLKYDAHVLLNHGISLAGMRYDSMLESYVLNSTATRHDMDSCARHLSRRRHDQVRGGRRQGREADHLQPGRARSRPPNTPPRTPTSRCSCTGCCTALAKDPALLKVYEEIEQPLVAGAARHGAPRRAGGPRTAARQSGELAKRLAELEADAHKAAGQPFNLDSPKQLQEILFDQATACRSMRKTRTGQPSTAEDVLEELADKYLLPRIILEYRGLAKLRSTYTEKLPGQIDAETGRVHTSYHQAVAVTGRLSSSDPNLQNIPIRTPEGRRIRQAFIAPKGHVLLAADYSQIELRIMAHLSGDDGLRRAFADDGDIHRATAAEVFDVAPDSGH